MMTRRPWELHEERYLQKNYLRKSIKEIAEILGRSHSMISAKANYMGLRKQGRNEERPLNRIRDRIELKLPRNPSCDIIQLIKAHDKLTSTTCRWPIGCPHEPNFHFCCRRTKITEAYCEEHREIAFTRPKKPEEKLPKHKLRFPF